ncbi:DNA-binding domain-containing protein, AraC-type [Pseudomonas asplenii]|uniref:DNA-binding domain-containing protein, AraC-type n=2 Tax=Pseudomonas asplenii TaxID=53407 RepID=A0A0N1J645_9PSED|nr:AraC family transcriptional regulator [Pseudomonas fuscovaginae]KPA92281.1 DNA-binding domain-containing protein, AraC-type [Pseudomonas fuscovaginae]
MTSIDRLIGLAGVRGSLDLRCRLQGDWALDHEQENAGIAPYHIVLAGECQVELPDGQAVRLGAGDILVLPGGGTHLLRSEGRRVAPTATRVSQGGLLPLHRIGREGPALDLLCGRFHYQRESMLFAALPPYLVVSSRDLPASDQLAALVGLLRVEADGDQAGGRFLVDALSSALFTLILRVYLQQQVQASGTLALLADKRLSRAWQGMLDDPAHAWNIDGLAALANMSRATFMRAFVKVAGESPWVLLTRVRMELAHGLLSRSHLGLSEIALQVGYQSQAAFSKKFKEVYGQAPGQVRKAGG